MKNFLFILLLLISTANFGQKNRIGFKLLPGLADIHSPDETQIFQNRLRPRFTFNFGGQYIREIKESLFFLETGVYFTDRGSLQKDFVSSYHDFNGTSSFTSDIYHHSYNLSLPILFRVEYKSFYASLGPSLDYYLNSKNVYVGDQNKTEKLNFSQGFPDDLKLGLDINLGLQLNLSEKISLFMESSFHPSGFSQNSVSKKWHYFLNYELGFGMSFEL